MDQRQRQRREQVRWRAAGLFAAGVTAPQVAVILEVSTKSAYQWRRSWVAGGTAGLASKGAPGPQPVLSDAQLLRLGQRLAAGPAAAGYGDDQRWTLVRVVAVIAGLFHLRVSVSTAWQVMRRLGYTVQLPVHRAIERDEDAIASWRRYQWPALKESPPAAVRGSVSLTSAGRR
ncbi:winged helix-turn-helix domain-containing protein [Paractinoplanes toevensis]|uniref:Winged helix-turn helix domain-containing protein n=1 Tax=Paractinoplanes toevensis TaxID=571911 RepID=A0A919T9Q7_9ACTN|nr:winged helix-turn-helix domain-containing protein [Actinoplanes toevensis]GIM90146.1 hypothetical protein Ato02nite_019390 [Actinoplanes toevensis]